MPAPTITELPTPPSRGDAPDVFASRADAFLGALPTFADETNAVGAYVDDKASEIEDIVANAGYVGTSTTTVTLGTGAKSLTTQADLAYIPGVYVTVVDSTAPTVNSMIGLVTAYDDETGALTINSLLSKGTGDVSTWAISLSGPPGSDATVTKSAVEGAVGGPVALRDDVMVTITGATHTLDAADSGKVHRFTSNSAVAVTLPNSLPVGWNAVWRQIGTGQVTFTSASGATLRNRLNNTKSAGQYSEGSLAVDNNAGSAAIYFLSGDTSI